MKSILSFLHHQLLFFSLEIFRSGDTHPSFCLIRRLEKAVMPSAKIPIRLREDGASFLPRGAFEGVTANVVQETKSVIWCSAEGGRVGEPGLAVVV